MSYDASIDDLAANAAVIGAFKRSRHVAVQTATWFVPAFDHVYRGGIHTALRLADALSRFEGTHNRLVISRGTPDVDENDLHAQVEKAFPDLRFDLLITGPGLAMQSLPESDIAIATLWTTAYDLLRFNQTRGKFYLVQDFEPAFQSANAVYALAEQTYRFGFSGIANTPGVAERFTAYGNEAISFVPGVDRSLYRPDDSGRSSERVRIVMYGRPNNPRNGFELGIEALRRVKRLYGDHVDIRSVGAEYDEARYGLDGVLVNLGVLPDPEAVAEIYRNSDIGLVFMFTAHPSYQPLEFMASGCATVTNINESNGWLLKHEHNALLTIPTVSGVTAAIERLIGDQDLRKRIVRGGLETVADFDWEPELRRVISWIKAGVVS
jgi:glycosyltransferase involved in cell wall biosynthesis